MNKQKRRVGLLVFLRGSSNPTMRMPGCCNYDHRYGGCMGDVSCAVEQGRRCAFFERVVLPTAADIGQHDEMHRLYAQHIGLMDAPKPERKRTRPCPDCGAELRPRRRYCDDCKARRRRATYRKARHRGALTMVGSQQLA